MIDEMFDLFSIKRFYFQKRLSNQFKLVTIFSENLFRALITFFDDALNFLINFVSDLITVVLFVVEITALRIPDRPETVQIATVQVFLTYRIL